MQSTAYQQQEPLGNPMVPFRCLILVPSLIRAGAETQAVELANGLAARGHTIHMCCFEQEVDQRSRISASVRFHHVMRRSKFDTSLPERLAKVIDAEGIEVVQGVLQFATLQAWLAARRSRAKPAVVAAVHTTRNRDLKQELQERLVYNRVLRQLQAVVFVCNHQKDHWVGKYPALERLSAVVHNGLDPERFRRDDFADSGRRLRADLGIGPDQAVFACVAAFRPEKGHRTLLEAFSRAGGDSCLVFAGDGPLRASAEALASEYGLAGRTRFLGNISDVRPLLAASTATVLASDVETFSMAMLESMAMGVPMIAPRVGGLPEAILHEETGLLFSAGDIPGLADRLRRIASSPAEATRMGDLAQRKVQEDFTFAAMVTGTERVLARAARS